MAENSSGGTSETKPNGICRTGCKTQDHESYGACLRDSNLQIGNLGHDDD